MNSNDFLSNSLRTLTILSILKEETDPHHRLSMRELLRCLDRRGFEAERKAVYRAIEALQTAGYDIRFERTGGKMGYVFYPDFSPSEILFLANAANESPSLSARESQLLSEKLKGMLSVHDRKALPLQKAFAGKSDNEDIMQSIGILIEAITAGSGIRFRYYDLTVTKKKQYRRNRQAYRLLPVAILTNSGRYYCVCYSNEHRAFANYRIDKMTSLSLSDDEYDPVPFDEARWIESSFMMYRGDPVTVTLECDLSLAPIVFDQFGRKLIISKITKNTFTVSIRSSLSPTLVSWILMFYDRIRVKAPKSLIKERYCSNGIKAP